MTYLSVCVDIDSFVVVAEEQLHPIRVWQRDDGVRRDGPSGVLGEVDVVDGGRVEVDRMEAAGRAVNHLKEEKTFIIANTNGYPV
jgi:hypothetical protein